MVKCLPNAVGMSWKPPERDAVFFFFFFSRNLSFGSKLSIQLLQILRIDDFFSKKYFLHTTILLWWMEANKRGQYCFQILLAILLPVRVRAIISALDYFICSHLQTQTGFFTWKWEGGSSGPLWSVGELAMWAGPFIFPTQPLWVLSADQQKNSSPIGSGSPGEVSIHVLRGCGPKRKRLSHAYLFKSFLKHICQLPPFCILSKDSEFPQYMCVQFYCSALGM